MSDWYPQVVRVEKIEKHPDADRLNILTVLSDYPVITNMVDLKVGDLIGYLPIDSIVPDVEDFYFLCPRKFEKQGENHVCVGSKYKLGEVPEKYRIIKAKLIRGIYSQGMLVSVPAEMKEGDSIVDLFSLKKWEEEEEDNLPNLPRFSGKNAEKDPKGWKIPYYDIDGLRKYVKFISPDEEIVLTEKLHGCNYAACYDGERLWVKSRNFYKKLDPKDLWWEVSLRNNFEEKISKYPMLIFFGELYGKVKGFRYDCDVDETNCLLTRVRFFDVLDTKSGRYLDYDEFIQIIDELGLDRVPELYRGCWGEKEKMYEFAEGNSILNPSHIREGFVLRTTKERFDPHLRGRVLLKLVGQGYNLKK